MARRIIHVDMDEFFAAVEKLDRPELRGKPLLIGGDPKGRGVVSTASYEARKYGCRSAMPMAQALRLCPDAVVLPVRGERYREVSERVFAVFDRFTPVVEPASIDEAFLDVTGCEKLFGPAVEVARKLKRAVKEETGLTASVGVAPNKFLAKLASDLEKPDGLVVITEQRIHEVLDPLPVEKLWGVGKAALKRFHRFGIRTIGTLRATPLSTLKELFGNQAEHYLALANGRDDREVVTEREPKSFGRERTFAEDIKDRDKLRSILLAQTEDVARRLRRHRMEARTVTVKFRYGDFTTRTRSTTLPEPTNVTEELWCHVRRIFDAWAERTGRPLRLLGVTASNLTLETGDRLSLFCDPARKKLRDLDRAVDEITEKFGSSAVERGSIRNGT